mgnify:FL=1
MQLSVFQQSFYKITTKSNNQNILPDCRVFESLLNALKTAKIIDRKKKTPGSLCINEIVALESPSSNFEDEGRYVTQVEIGNQKLFYFLNKDGMAHLERSDRGRRSPKAAVPRPR